MWRESGDREGSGGETGRERERSGASTVGEAMLVCVFPLCTRKAHIVVPSWTRGSDDPRLQGSTSFSILTLPSGTLQLEASPPFLAPHAQGSPFLEAPRGGNGNEVAVVKVDCYAWEPFTKLRVWSE